VRPHNVSLEWIKDALNFLSLSHRPSKGTLDEFLLETV
jgi:hypothetical protein